MVLGQKSFFVTRYAKDLRNLLDSRVDVGLGKADIYCWSLMLFDAVLVGFENQMTFSYNGGST